MASYFFSLAMVTLNDEISLVVYKSLYSLSDTNCVDSCSLYGPDYTCNFDEFWKMQEDERKKWMYNAAEIPASFDISTLSFASDTNLPAFDPLTNKFVGYKKSTNTNQNPVTDCSARPSHVEMKRFCPCLRKVPYRTFYVGRINTDCTESCRCHKLSCSTSYLSHAKVEQRLKIVNATAHLFRKKYNVSTRAIEIEKNYSNLFSAEEIIFWDDYSIVGWLLDLSRSDCNTEPVGKLEKRFCECLLMPGEVYAEPDEKCGTRANAPVFQSLHLCLIALMAAVWFW